MTILPSTGGVLYFHSGHHLMKLPNYVEPLTDISLLKFHHENITTTNNLNITTLLCTKHANDASLGSPTSRDHITGQHNHLGTSPASHERQRAYSARVVRLFVAVSQVFSKITAVRI